MDDDEVLSVNLSGMLVDRKANARRVTVSKNYFAEMCSGSEEGSHKRLIDFRSLGLRVIKKEQKKSVVDRLGARRVPVEFILAHLYLYLNQSALSKSKRPSSQGSTTRGDISQ